MSATDPDFESACRKDLDCFLSGHPNAVMQKRALKALRFLRVSEKPLAGKIEGWAAGIVYAVAKCDRPACGVPGLLNSEFESFFGVSMGTVRYRAANIALTNQ